MKPAVITGIVVVVIIIAFASYFALRSDIPTPAPAPSPEVGAPAEIGDSINDVIDSQIEEIANDVANAAKEGYISRREYYTPDSESESKSKLRDLTKIVLKNIAGKPIKAIVSRGDVSGVLKVLMTGVDPNVFKPAVSAISKCVSGEITAASPESGPREIPRYAYDCTYNHFSKNKSEFENIIAPAALTMYENAFNKYAPEDTKEQFKEKGGFKKVQSCSLANKGNREDIKSCMNGSEIPKITWKHAKPILENFRPYDDRAASPDN